MFLAIVSDNMVVTRRAGKGTSDSQGNGETSISAIPTIWQKQQDYFDSGATRGLLWRQTQLKAIYNLLQDNVKDWQEALKEDLGKHNTEENPLHTHS